MYFYHIFYSVCLRLCVSFSSGYHGSWVTPCCFAPAPTRRVPSVAAAPSSPPAPTRRGTNPAAWSSDTPAAPTLSAGEQGGTQQPLRCDRDLPCFLFFIFLNVFIHTHSLQKTFQLDAACFTDYYPARGGTNQWNQLLKCLIGKKSCRHLGQNYTFDW